MFPAAMNGFRVRAVRVVVDQVGGEVRQDAGAGDRRQQSGGHQRQSAPSVQAAECSRAKQEVAGEEGIVDSGRGRQEADAHAAQRPGAQEGAP